MDRQQLQDLFKNPYNTSVWHQVLIDVFGVREIYRTPESLDGGDDRIEGFELGRLRTEDGYEIGLFEFHVKQEQDIDRGRVGLRALVSNYLRYHVDAALVVYHTDTLWRLVFLQFVQKKGWLNGDQNFIGNLLERSKERFLTDVLNPLFFDTLNTKRTKDLAPKVLGKGVKIPYLNGGLFEPDQTDRQGINFPFELFEWLFYFFSKYNFTIDENDPSDAEVGIDPEMLGHIFENLLEDNKDKGAFYTPKEIVRYMCRESLNQFIMHHSPFTIEDQNREVNDLLKRVKICDPAIGSGAFPMGMLTEIFNLRKNLEPGLSPAQLKREIIQNNIYGVDIEQGAVDIARLRFWLSLVVDESEPQPLPNLDYKIMQGNSLLESFQGIDLSNFHEQSTELDLFQTEQTKEEIKQLIKEYFAITDHVQKERLRKEIDNTVHDHIKCSCGNNPAIVAQVDAIDPTSRPFFLWHVYFNDVFQQGGFDIVIGNPPYVDIKALDNNDVANYFKNYTTTANRINLYSIFIERGFNILNISGILCYVNPNSMLVNSSYLKLREYILPYIRKIIKLPDTIFETATVETIIFLLLRRKHDCKYIQAKSFHSKEQIDWKNIEFTNFDRQIWSDDIDKRFNIFISPNEVALLNKIETNSIRLVELTDFSLGITPYDKAKGHGQVFIKSKGFHSETKLSDDYVKLIKGANIYKYCINGSSSEYLKYTSELGASRQKRFFTNEKIIVRQILSTNPLELIAAYSDEDHYFTQIGFSILSKNDSALPVKYLLCLLNSQLMNFFHSYKYLDMEKITFPKILIENCKQFPIKVLSKQDQQPFIDLVDQILNAKRADPKADTSALEAQIDRLVYALYNLTDEEIKIIEEN